MKYQVKIKRRKAQRKHANNLAVNTVLGKLGSLITLLARLVSNYEFKMSLEFSCFHLLFIIARYNTSYSIYEITHL